MIPWQDHLLYLFPSIPLIQISLVRIRHQKSSAVLIAPYWPRQPWFFTQEELATEVFKLPLVPHLLMQDSGNVLHPELDSLRLAAWRICLKSKRFRQIQKNIYYPLIQICGIIFFILPLPETSRPLQSPYRLCSFISNIFLISGLPCRSSRCTFLQYSLSNLGTQNLHVSFLILH